MNLELEHAFIKKLLDFSEFERFVSAPSESTLNVSAQEYIRVSQHSSSSWFSEIHGCPYAFCKFKDAKKVRETRKKLKNRFWTEICDGAKWFYLSGLVYDTPSKRCTIWQDLFQLASSNPFLGVADRKCDRNVATFVATISSLE